MKKEKQIIKKLHKYKKQDFSYLKGNILGSMCTEPHPIAKKAYIEFLETNLGDPKIFPGTKKIELDYIRFIKKILNAPSKSNAIIGSGGTESNINAMWIAKKLSKKKELLVPENAHFSFEKIASLMDVKVRVVKTNNNFILDIEDLKSKISNKTLAVVGIAGSTELGTIDPIPEISEFCYDEHIFFHVDAAFGGFVIPFLKDLGYKLPDFDFKLKGVSSISIDSHKMGYSAIPLGVLVLREHKWNKQISVETPYISTLEQSGILGTRSGAPVAAAYAVSEYLGIKGYRKLAENCMKVTNYTKEKIEGIGLNLLTKPIMNVIGIKLKKPRKIVSELIKKNWKVNNMRRLSSIRLVLMPHVKKEIIDDFIPDLEKVCRRVGEI